MSHALLVLHWQVDDDQDVDLLEQPPHPLPIRLESYSVAIEPSGDIPFAIDFTRYADSFSPHLAQFCAEQFVLESAELRVSGKVQEEDKGDQSFTIRLEAAQIITMHCAGTSFEERGMETLRLVGEAVTYTHGETRTRFAASRGGSAIH